MNSKSAFMCFCLCGSLLVLFLFGCKSEANEFVPLSQRFVLAEKDVEINRQRAFSGDADAAFRLYEHYDCGMGDVDRGFYWLRKAAELGHKMALQHLEVGMKNKKIDTKNVKMMEPVANPFKTLRESE